MRFPFNLYLLALLGAGLTSWSSLPLWRAWCRRTGLMDDPGQRKIHQTSIPLAGGFALLTGLLLPLLAGAVWLYLQDRSTPAPAVQGDPAKELHQLGASAVGLLVHGVERRGAQLIAILWGALGISLLGWWDDKYELRPAAKFAGQLFIAGLTVASGVRITLFVHSGLFSYLVTVLWILTMVNAFNFMDNINGLCAGLGAISAWCFALLAMAQVQYLVASLGFLICGALFGVLPHNFPRATAFLGDTGSHLVGYLLAVLAILPHFYSIRNPHPWAVLNPLLVLAVPLADMVWVVALRLRRGQPFYLGDNNHLSHQLVRRGLSPVRAVLLLWLLSAGAASLAFIWA